MSAMIFEYLIAIVAQELDHLAQIGVRIKMIKNSAGCDQWLCLQNTRFQLGFNGV